MSGIDELIRAGENNHQLIFAGAIAARLAKTGGEMTIDEVKVLQDFFAQPDMKGVGIKYKVEENKVTDITFYNGGNDNTGITVSTADLSDTNNKVALFAKLTEQQKDYFIRLSDDKGNITQANEDSKLLATSLHYSDRKTDNEKAGSVNQREAGLLKKLDDLLKEADIVYSGNNVDGIKKVNSNPTIYNYSGQKPVLEK